ncbi:MAG: hypothetical protein EOP04_30095 [Proteobacteria bacterium]|nr:MAG: hypothetical protein EOP04_30095 [Pseudomonadota bacterium]
MAHSAALAQVCYTSAVRVERSAVAVALAPDDSLLATHVESFPAAEDDLLAVTHVERFRLTEDD